MLSRRSQWAASSAMARAARSRRAMNARFDHELYPVAWR